jgi:hypothetical protein
LFFVGGDAASLYQTRQIGSMWPDGRQLTWDCVEMNRNGNGNLVEACAPNAGYTTRPISVIFILSPWFFCAQKYFLPYLSAALRQN